MTEVVSKEYILNEILENRPHPGRWLANDEAQPDSVWLDQLVVKDYVPDEGGPRCSSYEESMQWICTILYYEFINRLDEPSPVRVAEAIRQAAKLARSNLIGKCKIEIRVDIERILRDLGFPALCKELVNHNSYIDTECSQIIEKLQPVKKRQLLGNWLLLLAAANLVEVWPSMPLQSRLDNVVWHATALRRDLYAFTMLAEKLEARLHSKVPVGLVTDNHGEIMLDMAFLAWLQNQFRIKPFIFPKGCPTELDIDTQGVEEIRRGIFPNLQATLVSGGSRTPGNLLTAMSRQFTTSLLQIQSEGGIIIVKGVGNLQTVPGILVDAIFLFTVKSERLGRELGVDIGSPAGLWVPAGRKKNHPECFFACVPPAPSPQCRLFL